jgi:hypothetical protein
MTAGLIEKGRICSGKRPSTERVNVSVFIKLEGSWMRGFKGFTDPSGPTNRRRSILRSFTGGLKESILGLMVNNKGSALKLNF